MTVKDSTNTPKALTTFTIDIDFTQEITDEASLLTPPFGTEETGRRIRNERLLELYKLALALYMQGAQVRLTPVDESQAYALPGS